MYWHQGWNNAPDIIKRCAATWQKNNSGWDFNLLALSSVVLWGIVFSGGSFDTYAVLLLAVPLVSVYMVTVNNRGCIPAAPVENTAKHRENRLEGASLVIFVLILFIYFVESNLIAVSLLFVVILMLIQQSKMRPKTLNSYSFEDGSPYVLIAAIELPFPTH